MNAGVVTAYLMLDRSNFSNGVTSAVGELNSLNNSSGSTSTGVEKLGNTLNNVGKTMKNTGAVMTAGITTPLVGVGTASAKTAIEFEASISKVSALSGATGEDLKKLENIAKEMGAKTQYSAVQSSEALSYMALAGFDVEQMCAALEPTLNLAASANMDLATASDIVTDTLSMFSMQASETKRMTDVMAYAQANANTDVQGLGEAIKYCGASANAMGYDIEHTTAYLAKFADSGLKGSAAGTTLNAVYRDMKTAAKDGAIAIGDTSVAIADSNGNYRSMNDILRDVELATKDMTQVERDMALSAIWGTTALKGINIAFSTGIDNIADFENELKNADGSAASMAETMQDNLQGSITKIKSALEGAAISIGERLIPILSNLADKIQSAVDWFNGLSDSQKDFIVTAGLVVAAVGPLLMVFGGIASGIGSILTVGSTLVKGAATLTGAITGTAAAATGATTATTGLATAGGGLLTILNPVTLGIAAAATGVGILGAAWYNNEKKIKEGTDAIQNNSIAVEDFSGKLRTNQSVMDTLFGKEYTIKFSDSYKARTAEIQKDVENWCEEIRALDKEIERILNDTSKTTATKNEEVNKIWQNNIDQTRQDGLANVNKDNNNMNNNAYNLHEYLKSYLGLSGPEAQEYANSYKDFYTTLDSDYRIFLAEELRIKEEAKSQNRDLTESEITEIEELKRKQGEILAQMEAKSGEDIYNMMKENSLRELTAYKEGYDEQMKMDYEYYAEKTKSIQDSFNERKEIIKQDTNLDKEAKLAAIERLNKLQQEEEAFNQFYQGCALGRAMYDEEWAKSNNICLKNIETANGELLTFVQDNNTGLQMTYADNATALKEWAESVGGSMQTVTDSDGKRVEVAVDSSGRVIGMIEGEKEQYKQFASAIQDEMSKYNAAIEQGTMTTESAMTKIEDDIDSGALKISDFGFSSKEQFLEVAKTSLQMSSELKQSMESLKADIDNGTLKISDFGLKSEEHFMLVANASITSGNDISKALKSLKSDINDGKIKVEDYGYTTQEEFLKASEAALQNGLKTESAMASLKTALENGSVKFTELGFTSQEQCLKVGKAALSAGDNVDSAMKSLEADLNSGKIKASDFGFKSNESFLKAAKGAYEASGKSKDLKGTIDKLKNKEVKVKADVKGEDKVDSLWRKINNLKDKVVNIWNKVWNQEQATGVRSAVSGISLVGEQGPELMKRRDGSFELLGIGGPTLTALKGGERIFNAQQTERMALSSLNNNLSGEDIKKIVAQTVEGTTKSILKNMIDIVQEAKQEVNLNISNFNNNDNTDIENLATEIAFYLKKNLAFS